VRAAQEIGFPALVKASGGRGIRPVRDTDELAEVFSSARGEARSAFGDDTVYLELALNRARHVEVQALADTHGNVVHAFERDCSVQRRRQKVLEEAPAPGPSEPLRDEVNTSAVRLARHIGCRGAGTVEFLLTEQGEFFFIEMNTRIQVERPITEAITGLDLVAERLRIAGGEVLSVSQEDITRTGTALELRINAEDPDNGFVPTPGELIAFDLPEQPGVRVDTGFTLGDRISPFYDSMIAKVICSGADRDDAFACARRALDALHVEGVSSTARPHRKLVEDPELRSGPVHTGWLEHWLENQD
jgi:acetyl-CoA carboxylase biotin carboxylase subunit